MKIYVHLELRKLFIILLNIVILLILSGDYIQNKAILERNLKV